MANQYLIIGVGRFGSAVARTLYHLGQEVVAIDIEEDAIEAIMDSVTHAMIMDATDEDALKRLGMNNFDTVVVAIGGSLEANILSTVAAKSSGARHIISKAKSQLSARVLASVGANEVVRPEHDMGVRLAQQLVSPAIVDAFHLGEGYSVVEVETQDKLCGALKDLRLTNRFNVQVIAVNRDGRLKVSPGADFELRPGDLVVVIGSNDAIARFQSFLSHK
jgi:trk system potassium uptake protein